MVLLQPETTFARGCRLQRLAIGVIDADSRSTQALKCVEGSLLRFPVGNLLKLAPVCQNGPSARFAWQSCRSLAELRRGVSYDFRRVWLAKMRGLRSKRTLGTPVRSSTLIQNNVRGCRWMAPDLMDNQQCPQTICSSP